MNINIFPAIRVAGIAGFLGLVSLPALATNYQIDGAHSRVGFSVRHMMVTNVKGAFKAFSGTVSVDDADVTKASVKVEIDVASVDTSNEKRDEHLKGADFFDAAAHPKMTFASTSVKKQGTKLLVTGDLALHGVTKPVTLTVDGPSKEWTNPWGQVVRGASVTGKLSRKDFGILFSKVTEAGGVVVGDDINLEFDLELTKVAEAKPADAKPADAKPADAKPADAKPADAKK